MTEPANFLSLSRSAPLADWIEQFLQGNRRALSRLLTYVDDGKYIDQILEKLPTPSRRPQTIAITGPGGAGKSTLISCLIQYIRKELDEKVAVLACDPESPFTGGALLGDRVRMEHDPLDPDVYIRSLSSRGATGGLSHSTEPMLQLLGHFGFSTVIIETVGVGQDQVGSRDIADVFVLVVTPAGGDEVQWEKAGIMEAADLVVVNKADLPGADRVVASLRRILEIRPNGSKDQQDHGVPVLKTVAEKNIGIAELWSEIRTQAQLGSTRRYRSVRRRLLASAQRRLAQRFLEHEDSDAVRALLEDQKAGRLADHSAADQLLALLIESPTD